MGGSSKKESTRASDIARQERERAAAQAVAVRQQQEAAAAQQMREVQGVVAPTDIEQLTGRQITGLQPDVEAMLRGVATGGAAPVGTPLGMALQERLLADLQREPEDVLAPALSLLRQNVGQFAAGRGIVGSGLELEQLGRTGVELAIKQALAREQLRAQQVERATQGQQSLEAIGASRRGELTGFLRNLQALEDARRARQIGAVSGAAGTGAGIRSTGNISALERLSTGEGRAIDVESEQLAADRQARAAQQAAIGQLAGTAAGMATTFLIPGVGPVLAPMVQQGVSGAFGGGGGGGFIPVPTGGQQRAAQRSSQSNMLELLASQGVFGQNPNLNVLHQRAFG